MRWRPMANSTSGPTRVAETRSCVMTFAWWAAVLSAWRLLVKYYGAGPAPVWCCSRKKQALPNTRPVTTAVSFMPVSTMHPAP